MVNSVPTPTYLEQNAKILKINLAEESTLSKNKNSLLLCKLTIQVIRNFLFDDDTDFKEIARESLNDVIAKDINRMIKILKDYSGTEDERRGVLPTKKVLDKAYIAINTACGCFDGNSALETAILLKARLENLVECRNEIDVALKQLNHIKIPEKYLHDNKNK